MINDLYSGISAFLKSFSVIRRFRLWKYVFISGFISVVLGFGIFRYIWSQSDRIADWLIAFYPWDFSKKFLDNFLEYIVAILLTVIALLLYKYVIMVIVSPFMSMMSEDLERQLKGSPAKPFSISGFLGDLLRGARIAIYNLVKEMTLTLVIFLLGLIPLVNVISPFLLYSVQAYYAGFGNMDYYLERHANVRESRAFVSRHKGLAIANGGVFLLLLLIPVIGLFLAPALGTTAATLSIIENSDSLRLDENVLDGLGLGGKFIPNATDRMKVLRCFGIGFKIFP